MASKRTGLATIAIFLSAAILLVAAGETPEALTPEGLAAHWTQLLAEPLGMDEEQAAR